MKIPRSDPTRTPRRRLRGDAREHRIVEEAARLFAEFGFAGSTRELARRMGVAQPLLYRFFRSKQQLIDRVYETTFMDRWDRRWDTLLRDRSRPLAERLSQFYRAAYSGWADPVSPRLLLRAGLDNMALAYRYSVPRTDRVLRPVIAELRHEAGLPAFRARPLTPGERELALVLHGGIVYLGIRRHVFGTPLKDVDALIDLHVRTFAEGAPRVIKGLFAGTPNAAAFDRPIRRRRAGRGRQSSR